MLKPIDADLVLCAQNGDLEAVGQLYDQYQERIFRYILARVSRKQQAQDLTGEVFLRMVSALPEYEPMGVPFSAWLYSIARNLVTDHYRKEGQYMTVPIEDAQEIRAGVNHNPLHAAEQQLTLERVQNALAQINESQREVIRLRFLAGLSLQETAETMDKTIAAVKSLQHRGLLALRVTLEDASKEPAHE